ncbi:MAG: carotenoid oxygenase family protein [Chloroflexi bacterium]|nr:MAG: carotenoid oxygenase family protein [Chloroflexota bacterium]
MAQQAPTALPTETTPGWRLGFQSLETEHREAVELEVTGELPTDLRGTLYRIGPARHEAGGERYRHWFDGDGMVHAIHLDGGRAHYRNRFVATAGRAEEERAGRRLYAGFGTRPAGDNAVERFRHAVRRFAKNTANTNIVEIGGRLLALWEAGHPHRIDPVTLETIGEDDLGGALGRNDWFSAHPKTHPSGDVWNFGIGYGARTRARLYRCRTDGSVSREITVTLPFPSMVHDFALTERHAVFVVAPLTLPPVPLGMMLGSRSFADSLRWEPRRGNDVPHRERLGRGRLGRARRLRLSRRRLHAHPLPVDDGERHNSRERLAGAAGARGLAADPAAAPEHDLARVPAGRALGRLRRAPPHLRGHR